LKQQHPVSASLRVNTHPREDEDPIRRSDTGVYWIFALAGMMFFLGVIAALCGKPRVS
jgi:hypothetical protein